MELQVAPGWIPEEARQHWLPPNRRRGLPMRAKRSFATEEEAKAFLVAHPGIGGLRGEMQVYPCGICGDYHTARQYRLGDPRRHS